MLEKEANHAINFNLPPEVEQLQAMVHYDLAFDVNEEVENQQLRRGIRVPKYSAKTTNIRSMLGCS